MTPDQYAAEDNAIAIEQRQALAHVPPREHYAFFQRYWATTRIENGAMVANPEYQPTATMRIRAAREERERLAHERALEIARAGAPVTHIHNEIRRGWFW